MPRQRFTEEQIIGLTDVVMPRLNGVELAGHSPAPRHAGRVGDGPQADRRSARSGVRRRASAPRGVLPSSGHASARRIGGRRAGSCAARRLHLACEPAHLGESAHDGRRGPAYHHGPRRVEQHGHAGALQSPHTRPSPGRGGEARADACRPYGTSTKLTSSRGLPLPSAVSPRCQSAAPRQRIGHNARTVTRSGPGWSLRKLLLSWASAPPRIHWHEG